MLQLLKQMAQFDFLANPKTDQLNQFPHIHVHALGFSTGERNKLCKSNCNDHIHISDNKAFSNIYIYIYKKTCTKQA